MWLRTDDVTVYTMTVMNPIIHLSLYCFHCGLCILNAIRKPVKSRNVATNRRRNCLYYGCDESIIHLSLYCFHCRLCILNAIRKPVKSRNVATNRRRNCLYYGCDESNHSSQFILLSLWFVYTKCYLESSEIKKCGYISYIVNTQRN